MNLKIKILHSGILALAVCLILLLTKGICKENVIRNWNVMIVSDNQSERLKGKELAIQEREQQIESLLSIVNGPIVSGEGFTNTTTPRNTAIFLLGQLRASEAVPSLIGWLSPKEGQLMIFYEEALLFSAARALIDIGLPAVKPLLTELKKEGMTPRGTQCLMTLVSILGPEVTELKIKKEIESDSDESIKEMLTACLEAIENKEMPIEKLRNSSW